MKHNEGFIGMGLILVIIGVLVVGCGAYYLETKNSSVPEDAVIDNSQPIVNQDENNVKNDGKYIGFIKNISSKNGISSLIIDYVQWITPCVPNASIDYCLNGYTVKNDNLLLRTFPISKDVQVKLQTYSHDTYGNYNWNQIVPFSEFATALNDSYILMNPPYPAQGLLYWITLSNGVVTTITEQYQP